MRVINYDCRVNLRPQQWEPQWQPRWFVRNVSEAIDDRTFYKHEPNPRYGRDESERRFIVTMESKRLVRMFQTLDLADFPFDAQIFRIAIEMEGLDTSACKFVPFADDIRSGATGSRKLLSFADMQLHDNLKSQSVPVPFHFEATNPKRSRRGLSYSALVVELVFERRASYYIWNVGAIMLVICSFGFAAWAIPNTEVQDRLGVDFTLLLTAVAFKLLITEMLPRLDYFSKLDIYVLSCMGFLALLIMAHCVVQMADENLWTLQTLEYLAAVINAAVHPGASHEERVCHVDRLSLKVLAFVWFCFNVAAAVLAVRLHQAAQHKAILNEDGTAHADNEDEMDDEEGVGDFGTPANLLADAELSELSPRSTGWWV